MDVHPRLLLKMFNGFLSEGIFLSSWKVARLIPNKKYDPGAHHLSTFFVCWTQQSKTSRKMLQPCLMDAIVSAGDHLSKQHLRLVRVFRLGHLTIGTIQELVEAVLRV